MVATFCNCRLLGHAAAKLLRAFACHSWSVVPRLADESPMTSTDSGRG